MGLYSVGNLCIAGADMLVTDYRKKADAMAASPDTTQDGVLAFRKNDLVPDLYRFPSPTGHTASEKFDELSNAPGTYVYLYLYRDKKPVDEAYFTATAEHETTFTKTTETRKERVGLGWILGGVGVGLLALSIGFRQRRS